MQENAISKHIVDCAIETHRTLGGPGLLESVYERAMVYELKYMGYSVRRQVGIPMSYKELEYDIGFRMDLLVNIL